MKVPYIDLRVQHDSIRDDLARLIGDVFERSAFSSGYAVGNFEEAFAEYCGVNYCVGVNSGTSALHLALLACGIGEGDEVITAPNTFIATCWAISYVGAKPVFVDVDPRTYTINPEKIKDALTPFTKAIIPVHLYGQPADMDPISEIADRYGLIVVEDAAQAHGAEYKSKKCGSLADCAAFSFYPSKNLGACGEAGAVTTNNKDTADKIRSLRNHSQTTKYLYDALGFNYRMDGIQGAVLSAKLPHLDLWNARRQSIAELYNSFFEKCERVKTPFAADYGKHVYHCYELQLESKEVRNKLQAFLNENGIGTNLHYPVPVHLQIAYSTLGYEKGDFPETERSAECLISLPIYPEMPENHIEYTALKILSFFQD